MQKGVVIIARVEEPGVSGERVVLELDATLRETHRFTQKVTTHPIESGANVADNIRRDTIAYVLEGMISNSPIVTGDDLAKLTALNGDLGFVQTAHRAMRSLEGQTVELLTELERYEGMALLRYDAPRDAKLGESLIFTAEFLQVEIVSSQIVTFRTATPGGQKKQDQGQQPTQERTSILYDLDADTFGGFLNRLGGGN